MLMYHLHERGVVNFLDESNKYSIVGVGSGANIALYYLKEMMMNDTSTALKSMILINPFIEVDSNM